MESRDGAHLRPPRLIGHRGVAANAPENTLAGFRKAAALGVAWVEFDVRLSADGRCILLHDDMLERTTTGRGPAAALSFAEIRRLDAGRWFGEEFAGERVPSLEEAIEVLGELGLGAVVELKPAAGSEGATGQAAAACLAERWPEHLPPPLVSSFRPAALLAARLTAPHIARALLVEAVPEDWRRRLDALGASALHADERPLDRATVAQICDADIPLFAYTVNLPERARTLFAWGVSAVFTDAPDRIAKVLNPSAI